MGCIFAGEKQDNNHETSDVQNTDRSESDILWRSSSFWGDASCQLVNHVYLALVRPGYHSLYIQLDSPLLEPQSSLTFATDSYEPGLRKRLVRNSKALHSLGARFLYSLSFRSIVSHYYADLSVVLVEITVARFHDHPLRLLEKPVYLL